jgi:hypothetical protein
MLLLLALLLPSSMQALPQTYEEGPAYSDSMFSEISGREVFLGTLLITRDLNISAAFGRTQLGMIERFVHDRATAQDPASRSHVEDKWFTTHIPNGATFVLYWHPAGETRPLTWIAVRRFDSSYTCLPGNSPSTHGTFCSRKWSVGDGTLTLEINRLDDRSGLVLYRFNIN